MDTKKKVIRVPYFGTGIVGVAVFVTVACAVYNGIVDAARG